MLVEVEVIDVIIVDYVGEWLIRVLSHHLFRILLVTYLLNLLAQQSSLVIILKLKFIFYVRSSLLSIQVLLIEVKRMEIHRFPLFLHLGSWLQLRAELIQTSAHQIRR